jgi:hypothetical protein
MADLKDDIFQALGYTGGIHLVTEYLLKQWQKRVTSALSNSGNPALDTLTYAGIPVSATTGSVVDESGSGFPPGTDWPVLAAVGAPEPGQVLYTLYSIDSNPGTEAVLTFGAALLPSLSGGGGGAGTSPSTPALPGGSGDYAAPLLALGVGYLLGKAA